MPRKHPKKKSRKRNLKWLWISLGVLVTVSVGIALFSPKTSSPPVNITPAQAYAKLQNGAFFLDVRSLEEFNQFHIAGSTLIPEEQLQYHLGALPRDREIVVVCLVGQRSQRGTLLLQEAGFEHVFCLTGGLQAWMDAGYPVQQGP